MQKKMISVISVLVLLLRFAVCVPTAAQENANLIGADSGFENWVSGSVSSPGGIISIHGGAEIQMTARDKQRGI